MLDFHDQGLEDFELLCQASLTGELIPMNNGSRKE